MSNFYKIVLLFLCIYSFSVEAQNYQGKKHLKVFDGDFNGGIMYQYNDITFSVSIEEYPVDKFNEKAKPCEGNSNSSYDGVVPKYYYLKVTVENNGIYKVHFNNVPAISLHLKDFNNPTPFTECNNSTATDLSVSFDVRSMGADSKIVFDDKSQGDWFFGKPTIESYSTSGYVIKNPNIKRWPVYPAVNYLEYAKQKGYSITKKKKKDELDDFVNSISNDINTTSTKINTSKKHAQNNIKIKSEKVSPIKKTNSTTSNYPKKNKVYNETICRDLKFKATTYSRQMLKLLNSFNVDITSKSVMSQSNVLMQSFKVFSDKFLKAVEEDKLSSKCIEEINAINTKYAKQYENIVRRMYKNPNFKY